MPFVIPTAASGTESLVLGGLNISQGVGGSIMLDTFSPPLFKKRVEWVEGADSNGAILARDPLESVGEATVRVAVVGANRDDAQNTIGQIVAKLEEADRNPGGIPLVWTPSDSTVSGTAYVLTGEVTEMPVDWESGYMANHPMVTFTLSCAPGWYGTPVTYTGSATAGPLVTLNLAGVPGDVPADATLTITDSSSQSRRTVEWGAEWRNQSALSLLLDSDSLVTTGFSGTQTTRTGAYDPGAAGNSIITSVVASATQAVCGTGAQTHVGTFRVKGRIYSVGTTDMEVRFSWRAGDGPYASNDPVNVTWGDRFGEIDLGLITIPTALTGTQSWDGRVEAWANGAAETVEVDYLLLFPIEAGYGKATATYAYSPGTIVARDTFTVADGTALNTRTPDAGAAWASSGVATDFTALSNQMKRATSDGGAYRYAVLGSAMTDQEVSAAIVLGGSGNTGGLLARWTDASNHLRLELGHTTGILANNFWSLTKVVAGVSTAITLGTTGRSGSATTLSTAPASLRLVVYASGLVVAQTLDSNGIVTLTTKTYDVDLATGGALASGKAGILDKGASTSTRTYDNVVVSTPTAEPIALYSGRSIQIRYDGTIRESSSGGTWGRPQSYRGSRFRVNPAGDAARTTRVAVKASRNDLDSAEDANLTDQITLSATVTPRYSVVPRA